jgi:hypothetical protein
MALARSTAIKIVPDFTFRSLETTVAIMMR